MITAVETSGGYSLKVEYNESPWPNRNGYVGICRRGAHLFNDEHTAKKFMEKYFLREPRLRRWVAEKRIKDGKIVMVGRWK